MCGIVGIHRHAATPSPSSSRAWRASSTGATTRRASPCSARRASRSTSGPGGSTTSWPRLPKRLKGPVGIGHTRWATHGEPTDGNAHPHIDASGHVAVVHNGIVENAAELRAKLAAEGIELASDTDTEVIAQLVGLRAADLPLEEAVREALSMVVGTYGLAVVDDRQPDRIVVARNGSPVVLGVGRRAHYVASDAVGPGAPHRPGRPPRRPRDGRRSTPTRYRTFTLDARPTDKAPATTECRRATAFDLAGHAALHAQGDARAARHRRPDAAGPARPALRHRPPRRARPVGPRPAGRAAGEDPGLRVRLLRGAGRGPADRGAQPAARRRRDGVRVPLPQPGHRPRHPVRGGQPVGRDVRHPGRGAGGEAQGRRRHRRRQRPGQHDRGGVRLGRLHPRRAPRCR